VDSTRKTRNLSDTIVVMQQLGTRNVALLILAISLISTVLIFKTDGEPHRIFANNETDLVVENVRKTKDTDTDGDSVPDWEEMLKGTNPTNPNTFNVEGGDKSYIASREERAAATVTEEYTNKDNLTEQIARGTFGEYLLQLSGDHPTGYGSPEELATYIAGQSFEISNPTLYRKENLTVVNTNRATLLAYADALRAIDTKYPDTAFATLGSTIGTSITGNPDDPESGTRLANNLTPYISLYESAISDMLAIPVPSLFVNEHINLVNSAEGAKFSLVQLTKLDTDPARALLGAQMFPEYSDALEETYNVIVQKLATESIPL